MEKQAIKYLLVLCLMSQCLVSCIDPFSLDVDRQPNRLIVEGVLSDNPEFQSVTLRFNPTGEESSQVFGASVFIETGDEILLPMLEVALGKYVPYEPLSIYDGERYRLVVDIGDSITLVSGWQVVPQAIVLESAHFEPAAQRSLNDNGYYVSMQGFAYFVSSGAATVSDIFIRYDYQQAYVMESPMRSSLCSLCTGCIIVSKSRNFVRTTSVHSGAGKKVSNLQMAFIPTSYEYSIRKTLRILQFSINEDTYNYYSLLERQMKLQGSLFDPPPAVAISNIKDTRNPERMVYGFFEVSRVTEKSVVVRRSDSPFLLRTFSEICTPNNLYTNPQCADCRLKEGATHERPVWF